MCFECVSESVCVMCACVIAETTFSNLFSLKNDLGLSHAHSSRSIVALQKKGLLSIYLHPSLSLFVKKTISTASIGRGSAKNWKVLFFCGIGIFEK